MAQTYRQQLQSASRKFLADPANLTAAEIAVLRRRDPSYEARAIARRDAARRPGQRRKAEVVMVQKRQGPVKTVRREAYDDALAKLHNDPANLSDVEIATLHVRSAALGTKAVLDRAAARRHFGMD
jgi:hypothetical protein